MAAKLTLIEEELARQPPFSSRSRINTNSPFAKGLVAGFNGAAPASDIVSGRMFSGAGTGFTKICTKNGLGVSGSGGGTGKFQVSTRPETTQITILIVGSLTNTTNLARFLSYYNGSGIGRFDLYAESGVNPIFQSLRGTNGMWRPTSTAWSNSTENVFCLTYNGDSTDNEPIFYVNGIAGTATQIQAPIGSLVTAGTQLAFAGRPDVTTRQMTGSMVLALVWDYALDATLVAEISRNPWQIFEPEEIPLFKPVVTAQFARPISDVSAGGWTASTGSDLYAMLDETIANDSDYITSTTASVCEVSLGYLSDPGVTTGHIVRYRVSATGGGMIVRLRNNGTTIASWTHDPAPASLTTYAQTLSAGEAGACDYSYPFSYQFEAI